MCGIVGLIGNDSVAPGLALGLQSIQHRGQDAAGMATFDGRRWHLTKNLGMVSTVLNAERIQEMSGTAGIAHVRYPTAGTISTQQDAQPFQTRHPGIVLAHNGNLTNVPELVESLRETGTHVLSGCDAEPLLLVFAEELQAIRQAGHTADDVAVAVEAVYRRVRGAYSVVAILEVDGQSTLVAFRDPHGIRPGCYGRRTDGAWIVASESVALDVLDFKKVEDLPAGEVLFFRANQEPVKRTVSPKVSRPCVFERIYFARPDSRMEEGRVNRSRWRMGRMLAREWAAKGFEADVVVAVPDTSRPAAMAMAEELGIPNREGFIKNRYSGRTFIMPNAASRKAALRLKLNPIREMFEGNRVLLVDDSIVRGTTMGRIVEMLRGLDPKEVHVAIFSPPVRHPCYYGIDMPTEEELVASHHPGSAVEAALAEQIGADSVTFLTIEGLKSVMGEDICAACFDGEYTVPISPEEKAFITGERRS